MSKRATPMTMKDARIAVAEQANGHYYSLSYEVNVHPETGHVNQTCKVYIEGVGSFDGSHWETAIDALHLARSGFPTISEDLGFEEGT